MLMVSPVPSSEICLEKAGVFLFWTSTLNKNIYSSEFLRNRIDVYSLLIFLLFMLSLFTSLFEEEHVTRGEMGRFDLKLKLRRDLEKLDLKEISPSQWSWWSIILPGSEDWCEHGSVVRGDILDVETEHWHISGQSWRGGLIFYNDW